MASLYNIQQDLLEIFNAIEENGGEVTDEQLEQLEITQEEFRSKIRNYVQVVKEYNNNIDFCKQEKKAIDDRAKVYSNRVDRLKSIMLSAVKQFGDRNKKGVCFVELPDCRISTRASQQVVIDEDRVKLLINKVVWYLGEINKNGLHGEMADADPVGVIDVINAECRAENPEHIDFTVGDLCNTDMSITFKSSLIDFIIKNNEVGWAINNHKGVIESDLTSDKTTIKANITNDFVRAQGGISYATLQNNESLNIK